MSKLGTSIGNVIFDITEFLDDLSYRPSGNFCGTPKLMKYLSKYNNKSDEILIKLTKSKNPMKAAAAKSILTSRKENAE